MNVIELASGSGYNSLQSAAQAIVNQLNADLPGTQYEMDVIINAPSLIIKAQISTTNSYLKSKGAKPWPGQSVICYLDNQTTNRVMFQWIK